MAAEFGSWQGEAGGGTWKPQIDPALVDDPRFGRLLDDAGDGCDFSAATVLVTGASDPGSIGYAVARNFLAGGAQVVMTGSRDLEKIAETASACLDEAGSGKVMAARVNQGELAEIDELLAHLKADGGAFTHVYPFAAINHPALIVGIKPEDYARVFAVNVFGVYHLCVRHMRHIARGEPYYVVIPLSPNDGRLQGSGLYPATKQALRPLVVQAQNEYGNRRGGTYTGIDIAWTRSALMSKLEAGVEKAREIGLKVFEVADTADCCTLLGTPAAKPLAGTVLDAAGGFGTADPAAMAEVLAG